MSHGSGPLVEPNTPVTSETASPLDEDYEFQTLVGTDDIKEKIDSGIGLSELAEWCHTNNVPAHIMIDMMKRAIDSGESFIIY